MRDKAIRRFPAKVLPFDSAQGASWLSGVEDRGNLFARNLLRAAIKPLRLGLACNWDAAFLKE
jgi:hypothetical protein